MNQSTNAVPSTSTLISKSVRKVVQGFGMQRSRANVLSLSIALQRLGAACLQCSSIDSDTATAKMTVAAVGAEGPELSGPFRDPIALDEILGPVVETAPEVQRALLHNDLYLTLRGMLSEAGVKADETASVNLGVDLVLAGQHLLVSLDKDAETRVKSAMRAYRDERRRSVDRYVFTAVFVPSVTADEEEEEEEEEGADDAAPATPAPTTAADSTNQF